MGLFNDWNQMAKINKAKYPPGTRIELISMNDPHHPVESGTRGTVDHSLFAQMQMNSENYLKKKLMKNFVCRTKSKNLRNSPCNK